MSFIFIHVLLNSVFLSKVPTLGDPSTAPTSLIIDTHAGGDAMMVIAFLVNRPENHIDAVTISFDLAHVEQGTINVLRVVQSSDDQDIPVFTGRSQPPAGNHFLSG